MRPWGKARRYKAATDSAWSSNQIHGVVFEKVVGIVNPRLYFSLQFTIHCTPNLSVKLPKYPPQNIS